jgi:hypothetical protein
MAAGFCWNCQREIRHGVMCGRCANRGVGGPVEDRPGIVVRTLGDRGAKNIAFRGRTLADVLRWLEHGTKRRKAGVRRWIEARNAPATRRA